MAYLQLTHQCKWTHVSMLAVGLTLFRVACTAVKLGNVATASNGPGTRYNALELPDHFCTGKGGAVCRLAVRK